MVTLHLIRHGHYPLLDSRILAGRAPGHDLSASGIAQAHAMARALQTLPVRHIATSPMARAAQTAHLIAEAHGLVAIADNRLTELDYGDWTGRAWDTLVGPEWRAWNACRALAAIPGGETIHAVAARALAALRDAAVRAGDGHAVIVSHADVIRAMVGSVLGMPPDLWRRLAIEAGTRTTIAIGADDAMLHALNAAP